MRCQFLNHAERDCRIKKFKNEKRRSQVGNDSRPLIEACWWSGLFSEGLFSTEAGSKVDDYQILDQGGANSDLGASLEIVICKTMLQCPDLFPPARLII